MKLLILGGSIFLGRHLVAAALQRGHTLTLFNRGQRHPELFPAVEKLRGDRDGGLDVLRGRTWDAVVDTCGYLPRLVRASAELLAPAVARYVFISSLSVYADETTENQDETAPVAQLPADKQGTEVIDGETYGALKALCEQAVEAALPGRALIIRPGLIVGPHDPSDRFTYWPARVARGGEVLAPDAPNRPVQIIDVRDLAEWMVLLAEAQATGVYNATGPACPITFGELLITCKSVTKSQAKFTWVSEEVLLAHEVAPFTELPLWLPRNLTAFGAFNCARAQAAGLPERPLTETIRDTLAWDATRPADAPRKNGLSAEKEAAILQAWHQQKK